MSLDSSIKKFNKTSFQYSISYLVFPIVWPIVLAIFYFYFNYKIENKKQLRKEFKSLYRNNQGILLLPNHISLIDSLIQSVALGSFFFYLFNFKALNWNLADKNNFFSNPILSFLSFITKSIPVERKAGLKKARILYDKLTPLLRNGHVVSLFPQGGRGDKTIDQNNYSYGPGFILQNNPNATFVCLYMKGNYMDLCDFPKKGTTFSFELKKIEVSPIQEKRQLITFSQKVISTLKSMEPIP